MNRHLSYFQRWMTYTLAYLIFLQQPLLIAAEMVSFERAEHVSPKAKVPLSPVSEESDFTDTPSGKEQDSPVDFYIHRLRSRGTGLSLQLSPDLERLNGVLALWDAKRSKPAASFKRTQAGLKLEVYDDYSLTLVGDLLPSLYVLSNLPVTVDAERLINPLTIHAASVHFLKALRMDGPVSLWAKGILGAPQDPELTSITLPIKGPSGKMATVEARGVVETKGIKGNGALCILAGQFRNTSALLLKQLEIIANIENAEGADLCGRDSVWLQGSLDNRGGVRTKGTLVEKGRVFKHTKTSETFSAGPHKVETINYRHNGTVYSAGTMRVNAIEMAFGPQFHFMGNRLIANGSRIDTSHPKAYVEALRYIELTSIDDLDNRARLHVHTFDFLTNNILET